MLIVVGELLVPPSEFEAFHKGVNEVAHSARGVQGCLFFATGVIDPSAGRMLVSEIWSDRAAQQAFLRQEPFTAFARRWAPVMKNELQVFDARPEPARGP